MAHPTLGHPPHDVTAGLPDAAARLRSSKKRVAQLALQATLRNKVDFADRYDEEALRLFLRDLDRHIEQLAKAMETGEAYYVTSYWEWLVPVMRRRHVPTADSFALLKGLKGGVASVLTPDENKVADELLHRGMVVLQRHQRLAGDHKGNAVIRFFWKGAGIGDDKWI
jgi:hypothetical protein